MRGRSILAVTAALLWAAGPASAAPDKEAVAACVASHANSQKLRAGNKLQDARTELAKCAQPECPEAVRTDCGTWLGEVQNEVPSIVIVATDEAGNDVVDVRVLEDGRVITEQLGEQALQLDPGKHTLRFERAGSAPVEHALLLRVGERNRRVTVAFKPAPAAGPAPVTPVEPAKDSGASIPTATWILGGVGVVGLAGFGYFALDGTRRQSDLDKCRPNCKQADVDKTSRSYLIGDISLAVGVLSLGGAAYFLFTRPSATSGRAMPALSLSAGAAPGAGFAGVSGRF